MVKNPYSTPVKPITTLDFPTGKDLKTEGATLLEEMGTILHADDEYIEMTFEKYDEVTINNYIASGAGKHYDNTTHRWNLPVAVKQEKRIYHRMRGLLNHILKTFLVFSRGVHRRVIDTHNVRFQHKGGRYTSPDLVVVAKESSFETPDNADIGYSNAATYFDVKRESDMGGRDNHLTQLSLYAR